MYKLDFVTVYYCLVCKPVFKVILTNLCLFLKLVSTFFFFWKKALRPLRIVSLYFENLQFDLISIMVYNFSFYEFSYILLVLGFSIEQGF